MDTSINKNKQIVLDNDYYFNAINDFSTVKESIIDLNDLNYKNFFKLGSFLLKIDFNILHTEQYKKILKKLFHMKKKILKRIIKKQDDSKTLIGYIINYDENNNNHKDFILAINAILYKTRYERYNFIYDSVCDYLDGYFYKKNLCDFKDNKCGEKRNSKSVIGCCRHYKYKLIGPLYPKWVICEYLTKDYKCGAKCLSCKLYTCDYLRQKGVCFRIKDIILLDVFFRPLQKYYIKYMVYTPKEKIIKRLMML